MKRIGMILLLGLLCVGAAMAQKVVQGSLASLRDVRRATVVVDYSEGVIQGMSEAEYAAYERHWEKSKPGINGQFIAAFNDRQVRLLITPQAGPACTMELKVLNVTRKGEIRAEAVFKDSATGEVLVVIGGIRVKGGVFGTGLNLMGDGMTNLGKTLGKYIDRNL